MRRKEYILKGEGKRAGKKDREKKNSKVEDMVPVFENVVCSLAAGYTCRHIDELGSYNRKQYPLRKSGEI